MADNAAKQPKATLKAAMTAVEREVQESPEWLKSIYERNDVLDRYRREQRSNDRVR